MCCDMWVQVTSNISWRRHVDHVHSFKDSPWWYETGLYHPADNVHQSAVDVDVVPSVERRDTEPEGVMGKESKCTSYRASCSGTKGVS